ncbi:MAG: hypothetical protein K0S35_1496 [Geminicoccaceae bacterium]|jgi:hypothetical protein|nr:hypothetical protein [Geminicoccaceae bacterium]
MPTKRRKVLPRRIGRPVPAWAQLLLAGKRPDRRDPEIEVGMFGWLLGDAVPGLPDYDTPEAARLRDVAGL